MTAVDSAKLTERRMLAAGLRAGVELLDQDEQPLTGAAVELVVRACSGKFADLGLVVGPRGRRAGPVPAGRGRNDRVGRRPA